MELNSKQKATKYFVYFILIALAHLFQNVSGLFPEIFGARCFFLLPVAIILAMGEDVLGGTMIGLFSGLLWDLTASVHLGFNCIFIAVMCFFASAIASNIIRDTFITNMIFSTVTIFLYCVIYWLFFIIIKGVHGAQDTILSFYIPCAVYTTVLSPVFWLILNPIKEKLNLIKKQDY